MTFVINRQLLSLKVHFFLFNGALACAIPYLAVYGKELGITALAMGLIYTILPFLGLVSKPLFGAIADITQKLKLILTITLCITAAAVIAINFIPAPFYHSRNLSRNSSSELYCHQNSSYVIHCENRFNDSSQCNSTCRLCQTDSINCGLRQGKNYSYEKHRYNVDFDASNCSSASIDCVEDCYDRTKICDQRKINPSLQLTLFGIFIAITYVSFGVSVTLTDSACYNALENHPELYGRQRMWGPIGWGLFAGISGYLNGMVTGSSSNKDYSMGFYLLCLLTVVDLVFVKLLKVSNARIQRPSCKGIWKLTLKPEIKFMLSVFFIGMFTGLCRSYVFWYLITLGSSQKLLGIAAGFQCFLGELPFFFFAGWIIQNIGRNNTVTLAFIAYAVRFIAYAHLWDPWWVLPIEILQGPGYGAFYAAMTSYAKEIAPKGSEVTMQGIMGGTFEGLGISAGGLLGGVGFSIIGGRTLFFWLGVMASCLGIAHGMASVLMKTKSLDSDELKEIKKTEEVLL